MSVGHKNCQLSIVNYQLIPHSIPCFPICGQAFPPSRSRGGCLPVFRHSTIALIFVRQQLTTSRLSGGALLISWSSALMFYMLHVHCSLISQSRCKGTKEIPSHQIQTLTACKNLLMKHAEIPNKCKWQIKPPHNPTPRERRNLPPTPPQGRGGCRGSFRVRLEEWQMQSYTLRIFLKKLFNCSFVRMCRLHLKRTNEQLNSFV